MRCSGKTDSSLLQSSNMRISGLETSVDSCICISQSSNVLRFSVHLRIVCLSSYVRLSLYAIIAMRETMTKSHCPAMLGTSIISKSICCFFMQYFSTKTLRVNVPRALGHSSSLRCSNIFLFVTAGRSYTTEALCRSTGIGLIEFSSTHHPDRG